MSKAKRNRLPDYVEHARLDAIALLLDIQFDVRRAFSALQRRDERETAQMLGEIHRRAQEAQELMKSIAAKRKRQDNASSTGDNA